MIIYKKIDITTVENGILAHGVNLKYVMGAGVALAIRTKWPIVYKKYVELKTNSDVTLGNVQFVPVASNLTVANCFTQLNYGREKGKKYTSPDAVKTCLELCVQRCNCYGQDFYMPRIGCALGGLDWDVDVYPIVESVHTKLNPELNINICDL